MDIVLGVSIEPTVNRAKVRLVLVEGCNADGVTVEQDSFEVAAAEHAALGEQVIAAIIGTREGAAEGGCQLTSAGVTWTDPAEVRSPHRHRHRHRRQRCRPHRPWAGARGGCCQLSAHWNYRYQLRGGSRGRQRCVRI